MSKSIACFMLCTLVFALCSSVKGQQSLKIYRIGRLGAGFPVEPFDQAFRQGLRDLGYIEGKNITIDYRYAEGKYDRLPELAADLVRKKVDVIVAGSDQSIHAARKATSTIPIVMAQSGGPLARGLVESLARPGGNVTGVTGYDPERRGKTLEIFKDSFPKMRRVAVLWNPANVGQHQNLAEIEKAGRMLELRLQVLGVQSSEDLESAFSAAAKEQANGLFILNSPTIRTHASRVNEFAAKKRLPTMYVDSLYVEGGGLMSYGADIPDRYRRAAN